MNDKYIFYKKKSIELKKKIYKLLKKNENENEIRYLIKLLEDTTNKMEIIINAKY